MTNQREKLTETAKRKGIEISDGGRATGGGDSVLFRLRDAVTRLRVSFYASDDSLVCEIFHEHYSPTYPLNGGWSMSAMRTSAFLGNYDYALDLIERGAL